MTDEEWLDSQDAEINRLRTALHRLIASLREMQDEGFQRTPEMEDALAAASWLLDTSRTEDC